MKAPRGIRNNNPLNIRHSAYHWQGASAKQEDASFVQFYNMAYGYRAVWMILQTYYRRFQIEGKHFTVRTIIYRWAPPIDHNKTEAYIRCVLLRSGLGGKEQLLPPSNVMGHERLTKLIAAMTTVECGIRLEEVDYSAINNGYCLAFPENVTALIELRQSEK